MIPSFEENKSDPLVTRIKTIHKIAGQKIRRILIHFLRGSLGVVKNIEFKIVAYLPRFFMLIFVKFHVFVYRILLYSMI